MLYAVVCSCPSNSVAYCSLCMKGSCARLPYLESWSHDSHSSATALSRWTVPHKPMSVSQIAPYSLHSALLLTRAQWVGYVDKWVLFGTEPMHLRTPKPEASQLLHTNQMNPGPCTEYQTLFLLFLHNRICLTSF